MTDFPVITKTQAMPFEGILARLKDRNHVDLDDSEDVTALDRHWAAFSGDPRRLDTGDLMAALTRPDISHIPEVTSKIRRHLGFRPEDQLQFKTLALSPTQQVAITIITPDHLFPDTPTLVFGGGLAHPSSLYVPAMVKLAQELQTKVILFDTPGNGSSQSNEGVNQKTFYAALKLVIASEIPDGEKYAVAGHSLGSNAVYQLFDDIKSGKNPLGSRKLLRAMVINPIPTRFQEASFAARMSRRFMWGQVGSQLANGFRAMKATCLDLFDNNAPDNTPVRRLVDREKVPISAVGMVTTLGNQDLNDPSNDVGRDSRITVVLSRGDRLMGWDADRFDNRRGYLVLPGSHSGGLIGDHNPPFISSALAMVLQHGAGDAVTPALERSDLYSQSSGALRVGLGGTVRTPSALVIPEINLKRGLTTLGNSGLFVDAGIAITAGRQFGTQSRWLATPLAQAAVGLEGFSLPVAAKAGIQGGVDFLKTSGSPLVAGLAASLGVNLARVADIEAQARFSLGGEFQDVLLALQLQMN